MLQFDYRKHRLEFKRPAGTSRGVLHFHEAHILRIRDAKMPDQPAYGEASPLPGLSIDFGTDFESRLHSFCEAFNRRKFNDPADIPTSFLAETRRYLPSVCFAAETALQDLKNDSNRLIFNNLFSQGKKGVPINGLIWMGEPGFMREQIKEKIAAGFSCIKIKIGAIDFETEIAVLSEIRQDFPAEKLTLRVDANGAFSPEEAPEKLARLAALSLHSIEQPIRTGQIEKMAELCARTPLPIALDEELIGVFGQKNKEKLLDRIQPQFIILKPTLVGGFAAAAEWIDLAEKAGIDWWMTSALESNIGLNAVAQFTAEYPVKIPQGLGTGGLYTNNFPSPLFIKKESLYTAGNSEKFELNLF